MFKSWNERTSRQQRRLAFAALIFVCWFAAVTPIARAAVPSFDIIVPRKAADATQMEISKLKITVSVTSTASVVFTVTPPGGSPIATPSLSPGAAVFSAPVPAAPLPDFLTVTPPVAGLADGDPLKRKYVILLELDSNIDGACGSTMAASETWTIAVTAPQQVEGVCVQSLDRNLGACGVNLRTVPLTAGSPFANQIATVSVGGVTNPSSLQGCRPGVDAILVLDRSGSMSSAVTSGSATSKMTRLHASVKAFIEQWEKLRTNETSLSASPPIQSVNDRVGVVLFDSTMPAQWLKAVVPASAIDGLKTLNSTTGTDIKTNIFSVTPNAATSIGSGLIVADKAFTDAPAIGNRKVIVLMSDGIENTNPKSDVNVGGKVVTNPGGTPLANQIPPLPANSIPLRIYSLTVGSGSGIVDAALNEKLAAATGGFYKNSEVSDKELENFFLEVLQNFLKFSSVETFRLVSDSTRPGQPYQATIPVTSTTQSITFTITWDPRNGPLTATVTPPGGAPPIVQTDPSGLLIVNRVLPIAGAQQGGDWNIRIASSSNFSAAPQAGVPFNLIVMGDDTGVSTDLTSVLADYTPGDRIRLRARITELEKPVTGLNSQAGAKVVVHLVRPGESVGDLLSDTNLTPPQQPLDAQSPASARLEAILARNPNALRPTEETLTLLDNGNAANGDETANDGVYSAVFPAQLVGHHNFLFAIEGTTQKVGRFSRQHLRTLFVRAVPDAGQTAFQSSIRDNSLIIQMTPRTKTGRRMGPGFANYFWFTAPGINPVKPVDQMNGTYTATIPFGGAFPPRPVEFHFVHDLVRLSDSTTPNQLPSPLGPGNVVVSNVPVSGGGGAAGPWSFSLHGGLSIPHGSFNSVFNPGPNVGVDLEYRIAPIFALEGSYTFHRFNGDTFGTITIPDLNLHQFSLNGKVYGSTSPVRPFFDFGFGAYRFDPGSTRGGVNFGGGLQVDVTPTFAFEAGYNFHNVFTSGASTRFSTVQGGVRFRF